MSEFKFACPVCGQHMICDAARGGSVMECPTCFQKILAPQAPLANAKLILTGIKVSEKKIPARGDGGTENNFPTALLTSALVVALLVGAAMFVFRKQIFENAPVSAIRVNAAPPASDTNWTLAPAHAAIPDSPVVGRIHGQDFILERAAYLNFNGILILRHGARGPVASGALIDFNGAPADALAGKTINILADTNASARVTLRWQDETGALNSEHFTSNYALRLEFGALADNQLPGQIYLCTPDAEKSYLMGKFSACIVRPQSPGQ